MDDTTSFSIYTSTFEKTLPTNFPKDNILIQYGWTPFIRANKLDLFCYNSLIKWRNCEWFNKSIKFDPQYSTSFAIHNLADIYLGVQKFCSLFSSNNYYNTIKSIIDNELTTNLNNTTILSLSKFKLNKPYQILIIELVKQSTTIKFKIGCISINLAESNMEKNNYLETKQLVLSGLFETCGKL